MRSFFSFKKKDSAEETVPDTSGLIDSILAIIDREIESKKKAREIAHKINNRERDLVVINK